jgi:hypothetical protein
MAERPRAPAPDAEQAALALYYFHLRDGEDVLLDPEGRELPSRSSVSAAALREARALIGDAALQGRIMLDQNIDVEDALGEIVHTLRFADAVKIIHTHEHD